MKLLFGGNAQTSQDLSGGILLKLNGDHDYLDAVVDLGLSAGEARRLTVVMCLHNLYTGGGNHNVIIQPWLADEPSGGQCKHYFLGMTQTSYAGYAHFILSFDAFVHYFEDARYLQVFLQDVNSGEQVTVNGFVFSDGFDEDGRVDIGSVKGADAGQLAKAAKVLLNKAVQTKLTGAIQYMDDDGETPILTHTPTESDSQIIRTPS